MLWSHIGILLRLLVAEPRSTAGLLFPVSISVERSWWPRIRWGETGWFQEQGQCIVIDLAAHSLFVSSWLPFLFFHSMGLYCGPGDFWPIWCYSWSLALLTVLNANNNNNTNNNGIASLHTEVIISTSTPIQLVFVYLSRVCKTVHLWCKTFFKENDEILI